MAATSLHVSAGSIVLGNDLPLVLIAGPCVIESRGHALKMAETLTEITSKAGISLIYKSSFDKANRTSAKSSRGSGLEDGLSILAEVRDTFACPILTDVHEAAQCQTVGEVVDILQIPAFLCRQTDLLVAAGKTGRVINVKKGQFLAPWDVPNIVHKIKNTGNNDVMICERGTSFGYNTLVSDMRGLPQMAADTGCPIVFDATHSVQQPGGRGSSSSGQREFAPVLARAAVSLGVAAVFIETHDNPDQAPSDGPNMIPVDKMPDVIKMLMAFDQLAKEWPIQLG